MSESIGWAIIGGLALGLVMGLAFGVFDVQCIASDAGRWWDVDTQSCGDGSNV